MLKRGHDSVGVGVETLNLENASLDDVNDAASRSSGFAIGSPTLGGHMPTQVPFSISPSGLSGRELNLGVERRSQERSLEKKSRNSGSS